VPETTRNRIFGAMIERTGQVHKLVVSFVVTMLGFGVFVAFNRAPYGYVVAPIACVVGLAGFYAPATIGCPKCRGRFVWNAIRWRPLSQLGNVLTSDRCPECDFRPGNG
jgi:hypothetical protein